jgi:hypothetical protein
MSITCLQPDLGSVLPWFSSNYGTTGSTPGVFGAQSEISPFSCNSCVLFGIVFSGDPGIDPGDVTVAPVSNTGDVFTHLGSITNLGSGFNGSMRISYWYCLSTKAGANRITFTSTAAITAGIGFVELRSSLGGFVLDDTQSFNVNAVFSGSLSINGTGNDFYFGLLGNSQVNTGANDPPWHGGTFPSFGIVHGGDCYILNGTGVKGLTTTGSFSQNLIALAASFKEVSVSFPTLSAAPTSLTFSGNPGGSSPAPQTIALTASPSNVSYAVTGSPSWVGVAPASGNTPDTITVTPTLSSAKFISNGDFETGKMSPWVIGSPIGLALPAVTTAQAHSGTYSCVLGSQTVLGEVDGTSEFYQDVEVTPNFVVDFWYLPKSDFGSCDDHQICSLYDLSGTLIYNILDDWNDSSSWIHVNRDLSFLIGFGITVGQIVRLVFRVINDSTCGGDDGPFIGYTYMYVDDITLVGPSVTVTSDCTTNGAPLTLPLAFTPSGTAPAITGVNARCGDVGDSVVLTGTGFGASQGGSTVTVDGIAATATSWSSTSVTITVPGGITTPGTVVIQMVVGGITSDGVEWFTPCVGVSPTLIGLDPQCGNIGDSVTLTGLNFGSSQGGSTVTFNGVSASIVSWSSTVIVATVPMGATTGDVVVTVGGNASNAHTFSVPCFVITAINPPCAGFGQQATITGSGFEASQGAGTVTVGITKAQVVSWNDTTIVFIVPFIPTHSNSTVVVLNNSGNNTSFGFWSVCFPATISIQSNVTNNGTPAAGQAFNQWGLGLGLAEGFWASYWAYTASNCPETITRSFFNDALQINFASTYTIGASYDCVNDPSTATPLFDLVVNGSVVASGGFGVDAFATLFMNVGDYIQVINRSTGSINGVTRVRLWAVETVSTAVAGTASNFSYSSGVMLPSVVTGVCSVPSTPIGQGIEFPSDGSIYLVQGSMSTGPSGGISSEVTLVGSEDYGGLGGAETHLSAAATPGTSAVTLSFATIYRAISSVIGFSTVTAFLVSNATGSSVSDVTFTKLTGSAVNICCESVNPSSSSNSSGGPCVATIGIFTYTGPTPAINEGFLLSGFTGSLEFLNGQTVFVISVDPSAHTFTAEISGGGAVLPPVPSPSPAQSPGSTPVTPLDDMLDWIMIAYPQRTTSHLRGTGNPSYNWKDADGQKVWLIKSANGHPWDVYTYDDQTISHYITENGDQAQFSNADAYKAFLTPVPVIPRFFDTTGPAVTIDTSGTNPFVRTINCGADNQPLVHLGNTRGVTNPPTVMLWPGLGSFPTIRVDYYYGGTPATGFHQREQYFYVKDLGLVQWDHADLVGGNYQIDQTTTKSSISTGGCPTPVFPCYPIPGWIGGAPGVGGNVP